LSNSPTKTEPKPTGLTKTERRLRAQIANSRRWANEKDRTAATAPARAAFQSKFKNDEERREFYQRLTLASIKARRKKAG
jgi:hypothetical protein